MKVNDKIQKKTEHLKTINLIIISFIAVILLGAFLFMLPITNQKDGLSFIDALFLSVSAVCVTGLSPVSNISSQLNIFGDIVLMILIEIGGLSLVTILMFVFTIMGFKFSFSQKLILKEALNQDSLQGIMKLLKRTVLTSLVIQLIGAFFLFFDFKFIHNFSILESIGYAFFHAASSFNNAGFDLLGSSSLILYSNDIYLNVILSLLIVSGGIGFIVIFDIIDKKSIRKLNMHSKVVLVTNLVLLLFGTIFIKLFNIHSYSWMEAIFMSISTRTAGFTSVDLSSLNVPTCITMIILMFIGGSPASTAGGIKTTTIFTLYCALTMFAKGDSECHAFSRKISENNILKAFVLVNIGVIICIFSTMIIGFLESDTFNLQQITFEVVSAFGTTGLSMGITSSLSAGSKIILCLLMFVGRLGPITFVSLFNSRLNNIKKDSIGYVEGNIIIG